MRPYQHLGATGRVRLVERYGALAALDFAGYRAPAPETKRRLWCAVSCPPSPMRLPDLCGRPERIVAEQAHNIAMLKDLYWRNGARRAGVTLPRT